MTALASTRARRRDGNGGRRRAGARMRKGGRRERSGGREGEKKGGGRSGNPKTRRAGTPGKRAAKRGDGEGARVSARKPRRERCQGSPRRRLPSSPYRGNEKKTVRPPRGKAASLRRGFRQSSFPRGGTRQTRRNEGLEGGSGGEKRRRGRPPAFFRTRTDARSGVRRGGRVSRLLRTDRRRSSRPPR